MRTSLLVAMAATAIFIVAMPAMAVAKGGRSPSSSPTQTGIGLQGGFYRPVNKDDPHIQEIGRWAVSEHDKQANDGLRFNRVVGGKQLVVEGYLYTLVVDAADNHGMDGNYEAEVWEKVWENFRQLRSFKPLN